MDEQTPEAGTQTRRLSRASLTALKILGWCAVVVLLLTVTGCLQTPYYNTLGHMHILILLACFLTELIQPQPVFLMGIALLLADRRLRWNFALDFTLVGIVQAVAGSGLKRVFNRMRPNNFHGAGTFFGPMASVHGNSFPSGHATAAWALAALLAAYYPRWRWVFYAGALAVCWARIQLNCHYPADVVAGGVLGWFTTQAILLWTRRRRCRGRTERPDHVRPVP